MPTSINIHGGNCCKCGVYVLARKGVYDLGRLYCCAQTCLPPPPPSYQRPRRKIVYIDNTRPPRGMRKS